MLLSSEELDEEWIEKLNETFGRNQVETERHLDKVDRDKAQEIELKACKEREEAERKACHRAEITKEEEEKWAKHKEERQVWWHLSFWKP